MVIECTTLDSLYKEYTCINTEVYKGKKTWNKILKQHKKAKQSMDPKKTKERFERYYG